MTVRFQWAVARIVASAAALAWLVAPSAAQPSGDKEPARAVVVVSISRGEQREIQLCWDDGTGRAPAIFLLDNGGKMPKEKLGDLKGETRLERNGIVAEHDEKKSAALLDAFAKDGKYIGEQKGGAFKHLTVVAVRVSAARDAKPGIHSVFVRVVSGTGRGMLLSGEIRVAVTD